MILVPDPQLNKLQIELRVKNDKMYSAKSQSDEKFVFFLLQGYNTNKIQQLYLFLMLNLASVLLVS